MNYTTQVKMNNNSIKKIFSAVSIYTLCNIFVSGLAVVTSPIFTRLLSVEDYGVYSLFNSWDSIITCITSLGLSYAIAPAYADKKNSFININANCMLAVLIIPAILLLISCMGGARLFASWLNLPYETIYILFIYIPLFSVIDIEFNKLSIMGKYKQYAVISVSRAVLSTALSIVFITLLENRKYLGRIGGVVICTVAIGIALLIQNIRNFKVGHFIADMKYALFISIPMLFHGLAMILLGQIDRIMIAEYYTKVETGLYSFGYTAGSMIMFLTNAIAMATKPWMYQNFARNNYKEINETLIQILKILSFLFVIYMLVMPEIIWILADPKYAPTKNFVVPITCSVFCQYIYSNYCTVEIYQKKTINIAIGSLVAAVINLVLNYIFIPRYGYMIAALTTFAGYFFLMIFHGEVCKRRCKVNTFNYKFGILLTLLIFVIGKAIESMYEIIWIRYLLVVIISFTVILKYRAKIISIIKNKE